MKIFFKLVKWGLERLLGGKRASATLLEDLGSIPSTHRFDSQNPYCGSQVSLAPVPGYPTPFFNL